ncbi:unnamed protein product [Hydatigera taeniaeformis]|uniref:Beta-1,4-galactosyltransferase 7 n=1 Tax=Hydatigena taeniaeformis TaxID=6205 RepID=A0A0R3X827_HYDTA|nr:unnamed protein product [Hydatigera taeniaeformis]
MSFFVCTRLSFFQKYCLLILATSILILTAWSIIQPDCKSPSKISVNHTLGVIVPFRDRFTNLLSFLPHMHRYLKRKGIPHTFYIVNQADDYRFNRGSLLNVGVKESEVMESRHFESSKSRRTRPQPACSMVALHDVDLLPIDDALRYEHFGRHPYHLIPYWMHPLYYAYSSYIGGAIIISRESYKLINGFSNRFWGWGQEDDEFGLRMREANLVATHLRDHTSGLNTTRYTVLSRISAEISNVNVWILNVQLHCDTLTTPHCRQDA